MNYSNDRGMSFSSLLGLVLLSVGACSFCKKLPIRLMKNKTNGIPYKKASYCLLPIGL